MPIVIDPTPNQPVRFYSHLSAMRDMVRGCLPCEVIVTSDFEPAGNIPTSQEIATAFTGPTGKCYVKVERAAADGRPILDDLEPLDATPTEDAIAAHVDIAARCRLGSPNSEVWLYGMPTKNDFDLAKGNDTTAWVAENATLHAGLADSYDGYCIQSYESRHGAKESIDTDDWLPATITYAKTLGKPLSLIVWGWHNQIQQDDSVDLVVSSVGYARQVVNAMRTAGVRKAFLWANSNQTVTDTKSIMDTLTAVRMTPYAIAAAGGS